MILCVFSLSCELISPGSASNLKTEGVFIVNEGSFLQGNGDVSFYNSETGQLTNSLFQAANGEAAGDILQCLVPADSLVILVVNNSNRLRIVRAADFKLIKNLSVNQPRFGALAAQGRVYVTCWDGFVRVLDLVTLTISDSIVVGPYPEDIVAYHDRAYVANSGFGSSNTITIINTSTQQLEGTLVTGYGPVDLVLDHDADRLYVACTGDAYASPKVPGGIYVFRESTMEVVDSVITVGNDTIFPSKIAVLDNHIFFIDGFAGSITVFDALLHLPVDTLVGNFYRVELNMENQSDKQVYATTSAAPGVLKIFDENRVETFSGGVGDFPGGIAFKNTR